MQRARPYIGSIEDVPEEDQWNTFLRTGYRINYTTWKQIIMSLFEWHNETINIWTHLIGFITFFIILLWIGFTQVGESINTTTSASGLHHFLS